MSLLSYPAVLTTNNFEDALEKLAEWQCAPASRHCFLWAVSISPFSPWKRAGYRNWNVYKVIIGQPVASILCSPARQSCVFMRSDGWRKHGKDGKKGSLQICDFLTLNTDYSSFNNCWCSARNCLKDNHLGEQAGVPERTCMLREALCYLVLKLSNSTGRHVSTCTVIDLLSQVVFLGWREIENF